MMLNDSFYTIGLIFLYFIQGIAFFVFVSILSNAKLSKKQNFLISLFIALLGILHLSLYLSIGFDKVFAISNIITMALTIIVSIKLYHVSVFKSFVYFISYMLLVAVCECITMFIFLYTVPSSNKDISILLSTTQYQFYGGFILDILLSLVMTIIYLLKIKIPITDFKNSTAKKKLIINLVIISVFSFGNLSFIANSKSYVPFFVIIFNIACIACFVVLSIINTRTSNNLEITQQSLETEKLYSQTLNEMLDSIRTFKHDFNNIIQSMQGYLEFDDITGLKKYFSEILTDCHTMRNLETLNPSLIDEPSIFALVSSKYHTARNKNISMDIDVFGQVKDINIKPFVLCKILGILLDNAIEATENTKKPSLRLSIFHNINQKYYSMKITNSFNNPKLNLNKIFEKGFSTKENPSGLGLWEAKQALKKCPNAKLKTKIENNLFIQELIVFD